MTCEALLCLDDALDGASRCRRHLPIDELRAWDEQHQTATWISRDLDDDARADAPA